MRLCVLCGFVFDGVRRDEPQRTQNRTEDQDVRCKADARKLVDEENKAWAQMKETRHLQGGQKNVQVISGIGEEAYFTGNVEKGKVGVAAVVARKGKSHFALDSQVIEYRASPETMKELAKRIAGQLQ